VAIETRDYHAWVGRRERKKLQEQVLDLCRRLDLECTVQWRRAIPLRFNLVFYVSGEPPQFDTFAEQYLALLDTRIDELMAGRRKPT
jgi:hypothetical protein